MAQMMQVIRKQQQGPVLKLIFSIAQLPPALNINPAFREVPTEKFNINNLVEIRFICKSQACNTVYYFSYKKHELAANQTVKMRISCNRLQYAKECNCPEDFTAWINMGVITSESMHNGRNSNTRRAPYDIWNLNTLEVVLGACEIEPIKFAHLYEDEEFCDFHLIPIDGHSGVPVHRACLALHSEMFRRMLHGVWKETANGCLKLEGVNYQSLKYLKEYLYLGTLPNDTALLKPLLLLAKCYMIDNLTAECIMRMAEVVKPEDMFALQQFAVDNRIPELLRAILQHTPARTFQLAHLLEEYGGPSGIKRTKSNDENQ